MSESPIFAVDVPSTADRRPVRKDPSDGDM